MNTELTDERVLTVLAERLVRLRLNRNWTQAALAEHAGVSLPTVQRLESGASVQLTSWIRVLRALGRLSVLDVILPEPAASPIQQLEAKGKIRKRASSRLKPSSSETRPKSPWSWGDES